MTSSPLETRVISKVTRRLIPFMILLYLVNYIDRVNIGVAKLQMNRDLNFDDSVYAFGVSIFFIGYCLCEVPSNLIMERVGARLWIARIMISWGAVTTAMMFIRGPYSFYGLRLLLGVTEAGFFPGMILYLTYWIPARERARAIAMFMTSIALAGVIGNPLAGFILKLSGAAGLAGWQWIFLLEGTTTILLGIAILFYLTDRPEQAHWLESEERNWLIERLRQEEAPAHSHDYSQLRRAFADRKVWLLIFTYSSVAFSSYGLIYWMPTIIKKSASIDSPAGLSDLNVSLLSAIPFLAAAIGMVLFGRSADKSGNHSKHVAVGAFLGSAGMLLACCFTSFSTSLTVAALAMAATGIYGTLGPFWALPPSFLSGTSAAAGIALINTVASCVGGFLGPNIMGKSAKETQSYALGLGIYAAALFAGGCVTLTLRRVSGQRPTSE